MKLPPKTMVMGKPPKDYETAFLFTRNKVL
jgi:hypothetical protein